MKNNPTNPAVRVRIAPSPTGNLHIGTARTALFNYLFAQKNGGAFIVRIEDTDKERSTLEYEKNILDGMKQLGMEYDEFYRQSERTSLYKTYLLKMIENGFAYESQEEAREEGQRASVIRFKNPNTKITFTDMIRGDISFDTTDLSDFVIAKSLEEPLYHLAVVVDDHEMNISHVIRGEDHISNTPRQILIQRAIGAQQPLYAHIPLILSKERKKLSKRDGATSIDQYVGLGYTKEAIINFLAFLGWHPEDDQEVFTLDELIQAFDISRIQKGGAIFDIEKLGWFNKEHIKKLSDEEFTRIVNEYSKLEIENPLILTLIRERITIYSDITEVTKHTGEFGYLIYPTIDLETPSKAIWKDSTREQTIEYVSHVISALKHLEDSDFKAQNLKDALWDYATEKGRGAVLWPVRYLLSGLDRSPDPFVSMEILGKDKSLVRLEDGISKI